MSQSRETMEAISKAILGLQDLVGYHFDDCLVYTEVQPLRCTCGMKRLREQRARLQATLDAEFLVVR